MDIPDTRVVAYTNIFKSEMGCGAIAVYQGLPRFLSGKGFGDFFPSLLRRIVPIVLNVD